MHTNIYTGRNGSGKTKDILSKVNVNKKTLVVTTLAAKQYIKQQFDSPNVEVVDYENIYQHFNEKIGKKILVVDDWIISAVITNAAPKLKLNTLRISENKADMLSIITNTINMLGSKTINNVDMIIGDINIADGDVLQDLSTICDVVAKEVHAKGFVFQFELKQIVIEQLKKTSILYDEIYIDSINVYDDDMVSLLTVLSQKTNLFNIYFSIVSDRSYMYNVYRNSYDAMQQFDKNISDIDGMSIERVSIAKPLEVHNGKDIIKKYFNTRVTDCSKFNDIHINHFNNIYNESRFIVQQIYSLIEKGLNPSDIVITGPDISRYEEILSNLSDLSIGTMREKVLKNVLIYRFIEMIESISKNTIGYSGNDIVYFSEVTNNSNKNIIKRFFLRFGNNISIALHNGKKYNQDDYNVVAMEVKNYDGFFNDIKNKYSSNSTFHSFSICMYEYMQKYGIVNFMTKNTSTIRIWNYFVDMINELHDFMANEIMTTSNFFATIKNAMEEYEVVTGYQDSDKVTILNLSDAQNRKARVFFIVGCSEEKMPKELSQCLSFDASTIETIKRHFNINMHDTSEIYDFFATQLYACLTLASDDVYISYTDKDQDGNEQKISILLNNIVEIFGYEEINGIASNANANQKMQKIISAFIDFQKTGIMSVEDQDLYFEMSENTAYAKKINSIISILEEDNTKQFSTELVAATMKPSDKFSVSRIEKFNACPFSHFISYGLIPEFQKTYDENASSKGTYYHAVLSSVLNDEKVFEISDEDLIIYVTKIASEKLEEHNERVVLTKTELQIEKSKMLQRAIYAVIANIKNIKAGRFKVVGTEIKVGNTIEDASHKYDIFGIIDRIDMVEINGEQYARIIDYKTGGEIINRNKMELGIQLQLPIYMGFLNNKCAGIYYTKIADPIDDIDNTDSKKYQLKGTTLNDPDVFYASDKELADKGYASDIIQVGTTKNGDISKKSNVCDQEEMQATMLLAQQIMLNTINNILSGINDIKPIKLSDMDACKFCKYNSICCNN